MALSFCFFFGHSRNGKRFLVMGSIDMVFFVFYLAGTIDLSLDLAAVSCSKNQFTATSLNRYGMGYFDYDHTFMSWAKSSFQHCQSAKAVWIMCIILAVVFLFSAIVMIYMWFQERGTKGKAGGKGGQA